MVGCNDSIPIKHCLLHDIRDYNPDTHKDVTIRNFPKWLILNHIGSQANNSNSNNFLVVCENGVWICGLNSNVLKTTNFDKLIQFIKQNIPDIKYLPKE